MLNNLREDTDPRGHRHVIAAAAALAAVSTAAQAQVSHDHHDAAAANQLFDAASNCVKVGLVCMDHCLQTCSAGDTSLAACAREVDLMLSTCGTLAKLASLKSSYLSAMAKLALAVCQDCETECRKHADKHAACKACGEACAACAIECKKIAA
jgi:Cys-rich four helix bundle protein (predicted Tat secretion target)